MNSMKLSFIVPVYNVEDYLCNCLESLYNQSLPLNEFEIVIINDGSTDNSYTIAKQYSEKYDNIRLIDQKNHGLSYTRNLGIENASGEYVLCVDSDDFLVANTIPLLLQQAIDNDLDILRAEYQNSNEQGHLMPKNGLEKDRSLYKGKVVDGDTLYQYLYCTEFYSPLLLMKRSFVLENNLFFEPGLYFEDIDFAIRVSMVAKRVMYLSEIFYIYRLREGSITHSISEKKLTDMAFIILKLRSYSVLPGCHAQTRKVIEENITRLSTFLLLRLSELSSPKRNLIIKPLLDRELRPLLVSGGLKEKIVSSLFNSFGAAAISFLSPIVRLKVKLIGYSN